MIPSYQPQSMVGKGPDGAGVCVFHSIILPSTNGGLDDIILHQPSHDSDFIGGTMIHDTHISYNK